MQRRSRSSITLCVASGLFFLIWFGTESLALARAGGGRSSGSRSFSSGRSYQRSPSQSPTSPSQQRQQQAQPSPVQPQPAGAGRSFMSGLAGGVMGGLLGGMLFRSLGFAGAGGSEGAGAGGFGFSDLLMILVILGIIYFVVKRFRSRNTMQMSATGAGSLPYSYAEPSPGPSYAPSLEDQSAPDGLRHIQEMDPSFSETKFKELAEEIFFKVQSAWTKRDLKWAKPFLSQEMLDIFQKDVDKLLVDKQINRLENIAVREIEIVDAGQDRGEEFITVKFHARLLDYLVNEIDGQVVSGSPTDSVKFLEYWTFSRMVGGKNWILAGITQENDN